DWSSDVCSSDPPVGRWHFALPGSRLAVAEIPVLANPLPGRLGFLDTALGAVSAKHGGGFHAASDSPQRSQSGRWVDAARAPPSWFYCAFARRDHWLGRYRLGTEPATGHRSEKSKKTEDGGSKIDDREWRTIVLPSPS